MVLAPRFSERGPEKKSEQKQVMTMLRALEGRGPAAQPRAACWGGMLAGRSVVAGLGGTSVSRSRSDGHQHLSATPAARKATAMQHTASMYAVRMAMATPSLASSVRMVWLGRPTRRLAMMKMARN